MNLIPSGSIFVWCYEHGVKSKLLRKSILRYQKYIQVIKPMNLTALKEEVMKFFLKQGFLTLAILLFGFFYSGFHVRYVVSYGLVGYLVYQQQFFRHYRKAQYRLLAQLDSYLSDIRHVYYTDGSVFEALELSLEQAGYELRLHLQTILEFFEQEELNLSQYREVAPNKFFVTFYSICQTTRFYGDLVREDGSLFLSNLNYLKKEIQLELLKRQKMKLVFSGLTSLIAMPAFAFPLIERWAIDNLPETYLYYHGTFGIVVRTVILGLMIISYCMIAQMREEDGELQRSQWLDVIGTHPWAQRYVARMTSRPRTIINEIQALISRIPNALTLQQFLVQRVLLLLSCFVGLLIFCFYLLGISKYHCIHTFQDYTGTSVVCTRQEVLQQKTQLAKGMTWYRKQNKWLSKKQSENVVETMERYFLEHDSSSTETANLLAKEISRRVIRYTTYQFRWYYLVIIVVVSWLGCNIPLLLLIVRFLFSMKSLWYIVIW